MEEELGPLGAGEVGERGEGVSGEQKRGPAYFAPWVLESNPHHPTHLELCFSIFFLASLGQRLTMLIQSVHMSISLLMSYKYLSSLSYYQVILLAST